ncbi:MAG: hypothetical protein DRN06_03750 [Thermoprotei archaeon]|nr:MAG: hypothetical protein DRN06_03750 [Thermoprotei archaeon]
MVVLMVDWDKVLDEIDRAVEFFRAQGVKPTLRTLFYYLYSKGLLPNTKTAYKGLSKKLVRARKLGRYAWDFLEDKTRVTLGSLWDSRFSDNILEEYESQLREKLEQLDIDVLIRNYIPTTPWIYVDRWADQPVVPEIWIEKEAQASTVHNWVRDLAVPVRVNRGYSSWTFIYNNVQSLRRTLAKHDKVVIYYLGDLDPSGVDIQRFLEKALKFFKVEEKKVKLIRLAVTEEQVEKYGLPPRPEDAETLAKLQRDPRMKKYTGKYIVELDALVAYAPNEFRELIRKAIRKLWSRKIYSELKKKAEELTKKAEKLREQYKELIKKKILEQLAKGG